MVFNKSYSRMKRNKRKTRAQKDKELRILAYKLGQIEKGKKNPDSQVHESFNKGFEAEKREKKPLL